MTAVKSYHKLLGHSHTAMTAAHDAKSRRRGRATRKHPCKTDLCPVHVMPAPEGCRSPRWPHQAGQTTVHHGAVVTTLDL